MRQLTRFITASLALCLLVAVLAALAWQPSGPLRAVANAQQAAEGSAGPLLSNAVAIDSGFGQACAVTEGGGVVCWGRRFESLPSYYQEISNATDITMFEDEFACVTLEDGSVRCWSMWASTEFLGNGEYTYENSLVEPVGLGTGVKSISAGAHLCAVTAAGAAKCWGTNFYGQLGDGTNEERKLPTQVAGLASGVRQIAVGEVHTCALKESGAVLCWGNNHAGELGDGTTESRNTPTPVVGLDSGVKSIAAGSSATCAVLEDGGVKCWGEGAGEFAGYNMEDALTPRDVSGLPNPVKTVSLGGEFANEKFFCAVDMQGGAYCWGGNNAGELGDGTTTSRSEAAPVLGLEEGVVAIGAGSFHVCAVLEDGGGRCWGSNGYAALGADDSYAESAIPVTTFGAVKEIGLGASHACAVTMAGALLCSGQNTEGVLGDGTTTSRFSVEQVSGMGSGVAHIHVANDTTSCAVMDSGEPRCWGYNVRGVVGSTERADMLYLTPTVVMDLNAGVKMLAPTAQHNCGVTTSGGLKCWGWNNTGQIGDGSTTTRDTPVDVSGLTNGVAMVDTSYAARILADTGTTCVVTVSGAVKCWGYNWSGWLGDGTTDERHTPVTVQGMTSGIKSVAVENGTTCVLSTAGGVKCWGRGLLGDGTQNSSATPVTPTGLESGVKAIAVSFYQSCALMVSGVVKCWGAEWGPDFHKVYAPTEMQGLGGVPTSIAVGLTNSCAVYATGELKCWGWMTEALGFNPGWVPVAVLAPSNSAPTDPTPIPIMTPVYLPAIQRP